MIRVLLSCFLLLFASCHFFKKDDAVLLASIYGEDLYFEDIKHSFNTSLSKSDSILLQKNLIEKWVKNQALVHKAKLNLDDELIQVENQVKEYRNSLLIYRYQQLLLNQKLDTVVSDLDLRNFFVDNKANFKLKNNIATINYIKLKKEVPNLWKPLKWYKSDKENTLEKLEDYCYQFSDEYSIGDEWVRIEDIISKLPKDLNLKVSDFNKRRNFEFSDDDYFYFIYLKKVKRTGDIAPFELEKKQIKNILINKRKLDFLKNMENSIYKDAISKNLVTYE